MHNQHIQTKGWLEGKSNCDSKMKNKIIIKQSVQRRGKVSLVRLEDFLLISRLGLPWRKFFYEKFLSSQCREEYLNRNEPRKFGSLPAKFSLCSCCWGCEQRHVSIHSLLTMSSLSNLINIALHSNSSSERLMNALKLSLQRIPSSEDFTATNQTKTCHSLRKKCCRWGTTSWIGSKARVLILSSSATSELLHAWFMWLMRLQEEALFVFFRTFHALHSSVDCVARDTFRNHKKRGSERVSKLSPRTTQHHAIQSFRLVLTPHAKRRLYKAVIENLEYDRTWCEYENENFPLHASRRLNRSHSWLDDKRINILIAHSLIH